MQTSKFLSRKFLISVAAFLAAFCAGVTGVLPPEWCTVGMAVSAGIYAASEAYVDGKSAGATQTISTTSSATSVTATSSSQKVVENAFASEPKQEPKAEAKEA